VTARKRKKFAGKRFLAVDHEVLDHPAFLSLSGRAKAAVLGMLRRFDGRNNGAIVFGVRDVMRWAKCSPRSALEIQAELEAARIALRTQRGKFTRGENRQATTWRLTFLAIGDTPATHDYRHSESVLPKTKPRYHVGNGTATAVVTGKADSPYTRAGKKAVPLPQG
jgi:hypothetical protein